jgi:hypothetical protein
MCLPVLTDYHAYVTSNGQRISCGPRAANLHSTIRLSNKPFNSSDGTEPDDRMLCHLLFAST